MFLARQGYGVYYRRAVSFAVRNVMVGRDDDHDGFRILGKQKRGAQGHAGGRIASAGLRYHVLLRDLRKLFHDELGLFLGGDNVNVLIIREARVPRDRFPEHRFLARYGEKLLGTHRPRERPEPLPYSAGHYADRDTVFFFHQNIRHLLWNQIQPVGKRRIWYSKT